MTWMLIAGCLLASFVFSGTEAGILSLNRVRLRHRVKQNDAAAMKLRDLLANPERFLVTVLVVTNLMNIGAIALATREFVHWWGRSGYLVSLALFLPVYLFLLEVLPKSLFRRFPYRALAFLVEPLRLADTVLLPMHFVGARVMGRLSRHRPAQRKKLFVAREDFKYLTAESERVGALGKTEREMIHHVIDFRSVTTRQVMVPMEKVAVIPAGASVEELIRRSEASGHDRWPLLDEKGQISGLVNLFDLLLDGHRKEAVEPFQRRIVQVAPNERAYSVLRKLRAARATLAVVTEPGRPPQGVVTSEDLIRRLFEGAPQA